jgi:hypothetical protein
MMARRSHLLAALGGVALCGTLLTTRAPMGLSAKTYSPDAFVADAREGTRRYLSRQEAVNDGFTRVGVEFPAMGEHWVSFARVMEDSFVANRPSVLIYTNTVGGPTLAGVAYSTLLTPGETPPAFPSASAWHEHSGTVNDESLPIGHSAHASATRDGRLSVHDESPRLFILHAWIWTPNPDGVFATDNWSIPLARLGVEQSERAPRGTVRAIALAQDEDEYYRLVLRATLVLSDDEDSAASRVLDAHRTRAEREVKSISESGRLSPGSSGRLAGMWNALWADLERALPTRVTALRTLRAQM